MERIYGRQPTEIPILKKCKKVGNKKKHDDGNLPENFEGSLEECIKGEDSLSNIKTMRTESPQHESKQVTQKHPWAGATLTTLSTFKCSMCSSIYKSWTKFRKHMKSKHSHPVIIGDYQKFVKEALYHTCRICSQKILCCSEFLIYHMRLSHKMSLNEYRKQFNFVQQFNSKGTAKSRHNVLKNGRPSNLHIGDMCTFRCPECKNSYRSSRMFYCHSSKIQKQNCSFKIKRKSWYKYVENIVTHICQICSKLLLCDRKFIWRHTYHVHGVKTLEDYTKQTGCILEKQESENMQFIFKKMSEGEKLEEKVGNFCRFKCCKCGHVSNCWKSMKKHLKIKGHN